MDSSLICIVSSIMNFKVYVICERLSRLFTGAAIHSHSCHESNSRGYECASYRFVSPNTQTIYIGNFSVDKTTPTPNIAFLITTLQ